MTMPQTELALHLLSVWYWRPRLIHTVANNGESWFVQWACFKLAYRSFQ